MFNSECNKIRVKLLDHSAIDFLYNTLNQTFFNQTAKQKSKTKTLFTHSQGSQKVNIYLLAYLLHFFPDESIRYMKMRRERTEKNKVHLKCCLKRQ